LSFTRKKNETRGLCASLGGMNQERAVTCRDRAELFRPAQRSATRFQGATTEMATPKAQATSSGKAEKSKNEKFKEQAPKRVSELLKKVSKLGDLNKYEPSAEQVAAIVKRLHEAVEQAGNRLKSRVKNDDTSFQF
jgi:hypothetical protein